MSIQQTGLQFVARDLGAFLNATNSAARAVGQFVGSATASTNKLNFLRGMMQNFASDLAYVARHLLYDAFTKVLDVFKDTFVEGGRQVILYDQLSKSLTALAARELINTGKARDMAEALRLAEPIAKANIQWVEKLAILSPFESEDIKKVLQFAQAVGFSGEEAKILTLSITDWASATGQTESVMHNIANALGDMLTKGKVQSEEMRQLTRNGIPAWDYLSKAMGVSVQKLREMIKDGLVPANVGIKAIIDGLNKDFGGAAARFGSTLAGLTSSVKDLTKIGLREFFTGSFQAIQPYLERFVAMMQDPQILNSIRAWGAELGKLVGQAAAFAEALFASRDPLGYLALSLDRILPGFYKVYEQFGKLVSTVEQIVAKAFGWGEGIGSNIAKGLLAGASRLMSVVQSILDIINGRLTGKQAPGQANPASTFAKGALPEGVMPKDSGPAPSSGGASSSPPGKPAPTATGTLGLSTQPLLDMGKAIDEVSAKADAIRGKWDLLRISYQFLAKNTSDLTQVTGPLKDIMGGLGVALGTVAASGLVGMAVSAFKLLTPIGLLTAAGTLLFKAWETDFGGIRELAHEALGDIETSFNSTVSTIQNQTIPAIRDALPGAMAALKAAALDAGKTVQSEWSGNILPAITTVDNFFQTRVMPTLASLAQGSFPLLKAAGETAAAVYTNLLVPAIKLLWSVFSELLWPIVEEGVNLFNNALVPAFVTTAGFINSTLLPTLKDIFTVADTYLIPILSSLERIVGSVLRLAFEALAAVWNSVIIPGLGKLWQEIKPVLDILAGPGGLEAGIARVNAVWELMVAWFNKVTGGLDNIKEKVQGAIKWFSDLADTLESIHIDPNLLPHSPPPLAQGLDYIAGSARNMAVEISPIPGMFEGLQSAVSSLVGDATSAGDVISDSFKGIVDSITRKGPSAAVEQLSKLTEESDSTKDTLIGPGGLVLAVDDTNEMFKSFAGGMATVEDRAKSLSKWIDELSDKLNDLHIDPNLLPHSPPPLAQGLTSIASAMGMMLTAFGEAPGVFSSLQSLTGDLMESLSKAQDQASDLVEKMQQGMLKGSIDALSQARENLKTVFDLRRHAEEMGDPNSGSSSDLAKALESARQSRDIAGRRGDAEAYARANQEVVDLMSQQQSMQENADKAKAIADREQAQMEAARQEALANSNSEDAAELYKLKSSQIKDLADLDMSILEAKDDAEKQMLQEQRDLLVQQQQFELELFRRQAQQRTDALEASIQQIATAWADALQNTEIVGDWPAQLNEFISLITQLRDLKLPDWLQPGSPTPFELGLQGISRAMRQMTQVEMPKLQTGFDRLSQPATAAQVFGRRSGEYQVVNSPQFNLGVTTNNTPGVLFQSFDLMRSYYGAY